MPAKDGLAADGGPVVEAVSKRYVVSAPFSAHFHTQLLSFVPGDVLDANVGEYMAARDAPLVVEG